MLFKLQWQIGKYCPELEMGPGLVLMSLLSKVKELKVKELKVRSTKFKMESELLNAVNFINNISKKKVTLAKIEAFMRKKNYSLAKKILIILLILLLRMVWFKSGEMEKMQLSKLPTNSTVLKYIHSPESIDANENTEKNHIQQNKVKDCTAMETSKNRVQWMKN